MKKNELYKFKELLILERQAVLTHLRGLSLSSAENIVPAGDEADLANLRIAQDQLHKLGGREQRTLAEINSALARIESGDYGLCEMCGEEIAPARLNALPFSIYCVDCKSLQEEQDRRYMRGESDEEDWLVQPDGTEG